MPDTTPVLLSGASGAIGSFIVKRLAEAGDREIICLLRQPASLIRLRGIVGDAIASRLTVAYADLTDEAETRTAATAIGPREELLAIHCAGEISWTKSERLVDPINVLGARNFARLTADLSRQRPRLVFLSTAYCAPRIAPRNAYEASKQRAENLLEAEFADHMDLAIIKCSLVVGARSDGWIGSFNGLYPLVRLVAQAEVPCLIADRDYRLDTIPVDVVHDQIFAAADSLARHRPVPRQPSLRLVLASGADAISVSEFVQLTSARTNRLRAAAGLGPLPEISIVSDRQYRFLMRASKTWDLEQQFTKVEQISGIMSGYITHGGTGREIDPRMSSPPPLPSTYLPAAIDHWLDVHRARVLRDRAPEWLGETKAIA